MTLRHAAALALVGWYLMAPPMGEKKPDFHAPLSKWTIELAFDSALECDAAMRKWHENAEKALQGDPKLQKMSIEEWYASANVVCVATDDPRLKESSK